MRKISGASSELIYLYPGIFFLVYLLLLHSPLPFGDSYLSVLFPFQIICLIFVVMSAPSPSTTMDKEIIENFEVSSTISSDVRTDRRDVDKVVQYH